ncbi:MAG: hypothetical protein WC735_03580 [Candidatus Paceibacterota bacterium]
MGVNQENGLSYSGSITVEDSVNKDTDGDGILDWEEGLWGTDPTKKETTPGTRDAVAIENLKKQTGKGVDPEILSGNEEKLTETDKFSRELFATMATINQNGVVDQTTIDTLSTSLAEKIKNPVVRKVFSISDIKTINDDSFQAFTNYNNALNSTFAKYKVGYTVADVLQQFVTDENTVDASALLKLGPIIGQINTIIGGMTGMNTPQSISTLHLNMINSLQRLIENLSDMRLYDTDPIVAMGAISQYDKNSTLLKTATKNLLSAIEQKLNN